jgi:methylated-DNA-[protein]-cysteine S-methyltransferase
MNDVDDAEALTQRVRGAPPPSGTDDLVAAAMERAADENLVDVAWAEHDSPIGRLVLAVTADGLVRVGFPHEELVLDELAARLSPRVVRLPARTDAVRRQLDDYFAGRRSVFEVPVDWRLTRGFRRSVLEQLHSRVGFGEVVSYRELAAATGSPGASRAVGTAMATNPIPIVVPCHRVLRTGGGLGGYGGGIDAKRWLLRHEGALAGWAVSPD